LVGASSAAPVQNDVDSRLAKLQTNVKAADVRAETNDCEEPAEGSCVSEEFGQDFLVKCQNLMGKTGCMAMDAVSLQQHNADKGTKWEKGHLCCK